jgi:hypothetical protein
LRVGINYENAKAIYRVYKKEGRETKKKKYNAKLRSILPAVSPHEFAKALQSVNRTGLVTNRDQGIVGV